MCEKSNEEKMKNEKELATELKAVILFCNEQGKLIPEKVFNQIKGLKSNEAKRKLRRIAKRGKIKR